MFVGKGRSLLQSGAINYGVTILSITTLSITTLSVKSLFVTLYIEWYYAECLYAECRYDECRYTEWRYAECRYVEYRDALNYGRKKIYRIGPWGRIHFTVFYLCVTNMPNKIEYFSLPGFSTLV